MTKATDGVRDRDVQRLFLEAVSAANVQVSIYFVNSVVVRGHVRHFTKTAILLESPNRSISQIQKCMITGIVPEQPVQLREPGADDAE